jgi:hypothetical protein
MNTEEILSVTDILAVDRVERAFAEGQIVDRIEKVGFPGTVISNETIDFIRENKRSFLVIFKITDR